MIYNYFKITIDLDKEKIKRRLMALIVIVDGCWIFTGYKCKKGYGRFWIKGRTADLVHRVAYALFKGPIRAGRVIDHKCCNKACVNPDHLQAISQGRNIKLARKRKT